MDMPFETFIPTWSHVIEKEIKKMQKTNTKVDILKNNKNFLEIWWISCRKKGSETGYQRGPNVGRVLDF